MDPESIVAKVTPEKRSKFAWAVSDSLVLIKRSILHIVKNMDQLLSVLLQPIMFMLLFRYVFGGAIQTGGTTYVNFLVAGILVQSAAFGSGYTALGVATDMTRGVIDRFRSLPMLSSAVLVGHTVADLVRNTISSIVMIVVGLAVGFRPTASFTDWVLIFGLLMLFSYALSWFFAIIGLIAKSAEAVQWISFVFIFPLTFASSAFVPTDGMPGALRVFAVNQPITQTIEAIRALMVGTPVGNHVWVASLYWIISLAIFVPVAAFMFRRRSSR